MPLHRKRVRASKERGSPETKALGGVLYERKVSKEKRAEQFQVEPDKTLDLWDMYRPGRKRFPDLTLESPATDDTEIEPLK
jgi:hypothetical protein